MTEIDTASKPPKTLRPRLRRFAVVVVLLVVASCLIMHFSGRQTKSAWRRYKADLEARGERLDWRAWIPGPMPADDENFAATPVLAAIAVKDKTDSVVWGRFQALAIHSSLGRVGDFERGERGNLATIQSEIRQQYGSSALPPPPLRNSAEDILNSLKPVESELNELRAAATRPYARLKLNFPDPVSQDVPSFVVLRELSQLFELACVAELQLDRTDAAAMDLRVVCRLADTANSSSTLVGAMIRSAILYLAIQPFWEGWVTGKWSDQQLEDFQTLFLKLDLLSSYDAAIRCERAHFNSMLENLPPQQVAAYFPAFDDWRSFVAAIDLRFGNYAQRNLLTYNRIINDLVIANHSVADQRVFVDRWEVNCLRLEREVGRATIFNSLAAIAIPNYVRAVQNVARNQTFLNMAAIVCALERYHRANGEYPPSLDALLPQYAKTLPHDLITGRPLVYRRTDDGRFLLYSLGWNKTDDGGKPGVKPEAGDWIWPSRVRE